MAETTIGTGSTLAQKAWRPALCHEAERQAHMMSFVGSKMDSCIVQLDDLTKHRGDTVQVRFSPTDDTHDGFGESDTIRGNEQAITFDSDELKINWLGEAFAQSSQMSQQRVNFNLKKAAFYKLSAWWARRWEVSILNQLAGYTPVNSIANYKRSGLNAVVGVDSNHHIFAEGTTTYTDDQTLAGDTTATMSLDLINEILLRCQSKVFLTYPIPPASDGFYHLVIHPTQWLSLREGTSTGEWQDIDLTRIKGGEGYKNSGLLRGHLGQYGNCKIHVSDYVPQGVNSGDATAAVANVRRAVFLGGRCAHMAFGEGYAGGQHLDWVEQIDDYRRWGVLADSVFGIKTTIFNSEYYSSFVVSTYSHASDT